MITELQNLSKTTSVTPEQFQQLALIVLELAQQLEAKADRPTAAQQAMEKAARASRERFETQGPV